MKILLFNQLWFADEWRRLGHEVLTCGLRSDLDIKLPLPLVHIDSIIKALPDGFIPDAIVYLDNSMPLLIRGLEETSIPTLFLSVDAHHHVELHRYLGLIFDYTLVAQRDYIPRFTDLGYPAEWMPLWSSRHYEGSDQKQSSAVFVGNLDPNLNPERVKFLEALKQRVPLEYCMGAFWNIFPNYEVVVNQTVKGDLNFRVFEAMMSGSLLLTEKTPNGLLDLFRDGEHLITYERNNVEEAAEKIKYYLAHPEQARIIGARGREEILKSHGDSHRAARLLELLKGLKKRDSNSRYFATMYNLVSVGIRFQTIDTGLALQALASALQAADNAIIRNEKLDADLSTHLVIGAYLYDQLVRSDGGRAVINRARIAYPRDEIITLWLIREALNHGRVGEAESMASLFPAKPPTEIFGLAEYVISELLTSADEYSREDAKLAPSIS